MFAVLGSSRRLGPIAFFGTLIVAPFNPGQLGAGLVELPCFFLFGCVLP